MMHKPISHFAQKYSVLPLLFFIVHAWQRRCFPFKGQRWECFTSRRLIWDTDGLSLPRDTPLALAFCSWDSVIKLRTRTSLNLLCVRWFRFHLTDFVMQSFLGTLNLVRIVFTSLFLGIIIYFYTIHGVLAFTPVHF